MYLTKIFSDVDIRNFFNESNVGIVISDPKIQDNPMIYVNDTFCRMTGYDKDYAIGKNCRFLQGSDTDESTILSIRSALKEKTEITTIIKNYRKNGAAFWNRLNITPIFNETGEINYFMGIQEDITETYTAQIAMKERIKELELRLKRFEREMDKN